MFFLFLMFLGVLRSLELRSPRPTAVILRSLAITYTFNYSDPTVGVGSGVGYQHQLYSGRSFENGSVNVDMRFDVAASI